MNTNENKNLDDSLVRIAQERHEQVKQKSITNARQKVNGRVYPGKTKNIEEFKKIAIGVMLTALVAATGYGYIQSDKLIDYDVQFGRAVANELDVVDQFRFEDYQNNTEGNFVDEIKEDFSVLGQISDKEKELAASGEYEWGRLNSDLRDDAIQMVAEENALAEIQEMRDYYEEGGKGLGK